MTPKFESNWRQWLQNVDQVSVNNSKLCTKLVSMCNVNIWSVVDTNLVQVLESLILIWSRFWSCWCQFDPDCGVVDTNWVEKVESLMLFEWNFSRGKTNFFGEFRWVGGGIRKNQKMIWNHQTVSCYTCYTLLHLSILSQVYTKLLGDHNKQFIDSTHWE